MVEDLAPGCPHHPPLGMCVRHGRPVGQADDLNTFTAEDLLEASGELGVPIMEQEAGSDIAVLE
jgi:hypothetical protein